MRFEIKTIGCLTYISLTKSCMPLDMIILSYIL